MNGHGKSFFKAGLVFLLLSIIARSILLLIGLIGGSATFHLWDLTLIPAFVLICIVLKGINRDKYSYLTPSSQFLLAMFLLFLRNLFFDSRVFYFGGGFLPLSLNISQLYTFNLTCTVIFGAGYVISLIVRTIYAFSGVKSGFFSKTILISNKIYFLLVWLGIVGILFYGVIISKNLYFEQGILPLDFFVLQIVSLMFISCAFMAMVRSTEVKVVVNDLNKTIFPILLIMAWHKDGKMSDAQYEEIESEFPREDILMAKTFFYDDRIMAPIYEEIDEGKYDKIMSDSLKDYYEDKKCESLDTKPELTSIKNETENDNDASNCSEAEQEILSILNKQDKNTK